MHMKNMLTLRDMTGRGGFGIVWSGRMKGLDKPVAVKDLIIEQVCVWLYVCTYS